MHGNKNGRHSTRFPDTMQNHTCKNWAVMSVTSKFELYHQLTSTSDWCVAVVCGLECSHNFTTSSLGQVVYFTPELTSELPYASVKHIDWGHPSKKNVAFLYAIHHGAEIIYDTDENNILTRGEVPLEQVLGPSVEVPLKLRHAVQRLYNPYFEFGSRLTETGEKVFPWPRGFPLEDANDPLTFGAMDDIASVTGAEIGVMQSLINHHPDVDAKCQPTGEKPLSFVKENRLRALPTGVISPFNSQATIFTFSCFWGLFLPTNVEQESSDIWRSFITQRLMWEIGKVLAFSSPFVSREAKDSKDVASEVDQQDHQRNGALIKVHQT